MNDELTARVEGLRRLHDLAMQLGTTTELEEKLHAILRTALELHGARRGLLTLRDGGDEQPGAAVYLPADEPLGEGEVGAAYRVPIVDVEGKTLGELAIELGGRPASDVARELAELCARDAAQCVGQTRQQRSERERLRREQEAAAETLKAAKEAAELAGRATTLAHARLRRLLMDAPIAIAIWRGKDHVFELANPVYERMMNKKSLVGRTLREAWAAMDGRGIFELFDRVYQTGERFVSPEYLLRFDRSGTGVIEQGYVAFHLEPIREVDGEVTGVMAIAVDVTSQVMARKLDQAARDQAEIANKVKDEFLAMLSHELRNPLAPIATALQLLQLREGPQLGYEHEIIERQVGHLTRLVDDLLDISRITHGQIEIRKENLEISTILDKAVEMVAPLLDQRGHQLSLTVPRTGMPVFVDEARMAQVFSNLLTNAARYTEPGGRITVTAERWGGQIAVRVIDNGIGIAPEMLPKVFELFVHGHRGSSYVDGGLGLGLTLVQKLVELHGGKVEARSAGQGRGSEFIVRLPAAPRLEARTPTGRSAVAPMRSGNRYRILVVDDNHDALEMLADALRLVGHDVLVAKDSTQALRYIADTTFDVGVFDIGLPLIDGYELARRVRRQPRLAGTRLFALTGYGQEGDRKRASEAGFDQHLTKPLDLRRLLTLLDEVPPASHDDSPAPSPA